MAEDLAAYAKKIAGMDLDALLDERLRHRRADEIIKAEKAVVNPRLIEQVLVRGDTVKASGTPMYKGEHGAAYVQTKKTKTIDRTRLIAAGVDPDTIDACTVTSESEPFVKVLAAGEKE